MSGETILVVDDEKTILKLSGRILKKDGFEVKTAECGEDALKVLEGEAIDLLLTDVKMPGMSGLELLKHFKKQRPDNAAVIFTGHGTIDMALEAMRIGADGFVLKPFTKSELMDAVNNSIEKMRLLRENIRLKSLIPLFEMSRRMVEKVDPAELLEYVVDAAGKETGADSVSIMLRNDDGSFKTEAQKGLKNEDEKEVVKSLSEKIAQKAAGTDHAVILELDDPENDFAEEMKKSNIATSVTLPMKMKDDILGVMNLTNMKGNNSLSEKGVADFTGILAAQTSAALKNAMLIEDMHELFMSLIKSLSKVIDTKSPWTAGHSERVTKYALLMGKELGLKESDMKTLELAGILHDIGKIGVPENILNKEMSLTTEEFLKVKKHPAAGAEIISHVSQLRAIVPPIRHHHERYDGCGYPDGLKGEEIPLLARILAVADAYDAMKADRPYRNGRSKSYIIKELKSNAGKQFTPSCVSALLKVLSLGKK